MKKISKILLGLPILSAFLLTGCDSIMGMISGLIPSEEEESSEKSDNNSSNSMTEDDWVPEQTENKLKELGESQGFVLDLTYSSSEEGVTDGHMTIGMKNNIVWSTSNGELEAYRKNDDESISMAQSNESGDGYVWTNIGSSGNFEMFENSLTEIFYIANSYRDYLEKQRDTTFLGRPAAIYLFDGSIDGYVTLIATIDQELGITLKWEAHSGIDFLFEITSFKTGNQVNIPEIAE